MPSRAIQIFDQAIKVLGPLFVLIIGLTLKILIVDFEKIPKGDPQIQIHYMVTEYVKPIWLDFVLASFFLQIGLSFKPETGKITKAFKNRFFSFLGIVSLICLVCCGLDRLHMSSNVTLVIVLPSSLSLILFGLSSWITTKTS